MRALRSLSFRLHAWLGLHAFLFFMLMFLSGTLLVFISEIDALVDSDRRITPDPSGAEASFGAIYDSVTATDPGMRVLGIERQPSAWMGVRTDVILSDGSETVIWTHPATAEITGQSQGLDIRKPLRSFHDSLMTGKTIAGLAVSATSIALIFFIVTGLITYRRFWRGFFRQPPRHQGPRAFWGGMHRLIAVWNLPFLCIVALTSFYYFLGFFGITEGHIPEPAAAEARDDRLPQGFDGTALDGLLDNAREAVPDIDVAGVLFPGGSEDGITVLGGASAPNIASVESAVVVDPSTGAVLGQYRSEELGIKTRTLLMVDALHFGTWGGVVSRFLWLAFGTMATLMMAAGAMIYASKALALPEAPQGGAARRIWGGMSFLKWAYVGLFLGLVVVALMRFGPL